MNVIFKGLAAALLSVFCAGASLAQDADVNQGQPEIQAEPSAETQQVRQQPILQILVEGNERVEADTILSYLLIQPGDLPNPRLINLSIQTLYSTNLFSDVRVAIDGASMVLFVEENPIVNRVILEGNRAIGDDKITDEIELQARAIFTRSRVQSDVQRILEVYRRSGRFAAQVTPQIVELPQNRVDLVFEISEGPVTGVERISFVGNEAYSDRRLRGEIVTTEARWWKFFSSNDNYDPDRIEYDREQLRTFYNDRGFADFRVTSVSAELAPDQSEFYVTFTMDEGERYNFGEIEVETEISDLNTDYLEAVLPTQPGRLYVGSLIEDATDSLTFAAGAAGYAFVDVSPRVSLNREDQTVDITFVIEESPRVYIERIDIIGNTRTLDRVIRRELDLVEGDAFNQALVNVSRSRVGQLGFFEDVEVEPVQGSAPDRAQVQVRVTEQPTGELAFGAGFSSTDSFLVDFSISERNLRGRGQFLRLRVSTSSRQQQIDIRFTEPRFLDRNLAAGFDLFRVRSDFSREASFETESTGFTLRAGFPLTRAVQAGVNYTLRTDDVRTYSGVSESIQRAAGSRITSLMGYSLRWNRTDDFREPTRGFQLSFNQDFAGFGGDVRYVRSELQGGIYRSVWRDRLVFSATGSTGYLFSWGGDTARINDRFFKGGNSFRGFETAGIGPRVVQRRAEALEDGDEFVSGDALGGNFYAIGAFEMGFPLGLPEQYGIRGSLFTEFGTVGLLPDEDQIADDGSDTAIYTVDDLALRASAGMSIFWDSPFGPVRFDLAHAFIKEDYDQGAFFRFSTRTGF
ncbi:MAG: outer membrane protein assembly factor BamA [Oceanicaulis sp.]|jgi:outer membrane protein insertion porin family|uniref:outer membrane protein assembly factor BamA n=1 Tax=unclassified Oceanicaulis TaxID=2632123 RepID=UPI000066D6A1|nr:MULTISPECIES: outer membrane protein assembly factor BamA [unclassified Oceanicaulis]EAP91055.1 outer membrane protein [Oceanicaulis sp. HTCC2633]MAB69490.1 outer membrane protein assembly factor BamA [Oceanicaulis sp.]MBC39587.1 outer membrane protein assembly factor BamA [Oceanicaulis sp.]HBU63153.1 outer membrane protein assembly factor BamA [Oceanicaulis sp.]HCR95419.1 outer membrane protein assembly factor BamA [Oceanicaulis sp.]|tara:strand:+ start:2851 stop:5256 length:2406 start_codon:yes stop_codon:yes gene_type:complete